MHIVDLRAFVNTMMFNCTSQPGLSVIFLDLLGFEGYAFRSKRADALGLVPTTGHFRIFYTIAAV